MKEFGYKLSSLIKDQDGGGDSNKEEEVCGRESTRLEHRLQEGEVDDQQLSQERPAHGQQKHLV